MSSISVIIIEKTGQIKEQIIKNFNEDDLYKKAGFKTKEGFKNYTEWNIEDLNGKSYSISLYGKTTGKANQENKYDFPPPVDKILFFGNCIIVNKKKDVAISINCNEWNLIYQHLFGGFDDIEDDEEDDESEYDSDIELNKFGYAKDEFIDDDEEDEEDEEEDEEENQYKPVKKNKKTNLQIQTNMVDNSILKYTNELSEEQYV